MMSSKAGSGRCFWLVSGGGDTAEATEASLSGLGMCRGGGENRSKAAFSHDRG